MWLQLSGGVVKVEGAPVVSVAAVEWGCGQGWRGTCGECGCS